MQAPPPVELSASRLVERRARPRAGRRFTGRIAVGDSQSARVTEGEIRCQASVANRDLRVVVNGFQRGYAACAWRVPRWASGRRLQGTIRVRARGGHAVRWFARDIR